MYIFNCQPKIYYALSGSLARSLFDMICKCLQCCVRSFHILDLQYQLPNSDETRNATHTEHSTVTDGKSRAPEMPYKRQLTTEINQTIRVIRQENQLNRMAYTVCLCIRLVFVYAAIAIGLESFEWCMWTMLMIYMLLICWHCVCAPLCIVQIKPYSLLFNWFICSMFVFFLLSGNIIIIFIRLAWKSTKSVEENRAYRVEAHAHKCLAI